MEKDQGEKEQKSVLPGIFCDVTGTLVSSHGEPNDDVVAFLRYIRDEKHIPITLCSRIQDNPMAPRDLKEEFGLVEEKAIYRDQTLEVIIDNNINEYLKASYSIHPDQLEGFAGLSLDEKHRVFDHLLNEQESTIGSNPEV